MSGQEPSSALPRTLGFLDLLLLTLVAVINVSLLPPLAGLGRVTVALWLVAFLLFFVPQAVAVVNFARRFPGEGGIYLWARRIFGESHGFVSGWCYWLANLFYFPMQLVYLSGVLAYTGGAGSADSRREQMVRLGGVVRMAGARRRGERARSGCRQVAPECRRPWFHRGGHCHCRCGRGGGGVGHLGSGAARGRLDG